MSDQTQPQSISLSRQLIRCVPEGFFSPLSSRLAPVYIDCANRLELAAGESARLEMQEARDLIADVVGSHPGFDWPEDYASADVRVRSSKVLNYLIEARWLEDRAESLYERWVALSPALRPVLTMLRELADDSMAELQSFADTLAGICRDLEIEGILGINQSPETLRSTIGDLNRRLSYAITQLHSVEKIVHRFEQRQMQSRTAAETLQLVYDEFYEGNHMVCHDVLHRRGLLSRLHQARDVVRAASDDPFVKEKLATVLAAERQLPAESGWVLATGEFERLQKGLMGIRQRADAVDARIASFHQLSRQRFLYQSQMQGRRPEMARQLCDLLNRSFDGQRFNDLDDKRFKELTFPWRGLLAADVDVLYGAASLRLPRRARLPVSLVLSDATLAAPDDAERARIREQTRAALTPARAARLVSQMLPAVDASASTAEMTATTDENLLDLIAAASFNQAFTSEGMIRWRFASSHDPDDWLREDVPSDSLMDWRVERFMLTRTK